MTQSSPSKSRLRGNGLADLLRSHPEGSFARNVATLFSGKAGAFAIALVSMPIIARLFEPSHFGVAAFFVAIVSVLGVLATLRYDVALVLVKSPRDAARVAHLAALLSLTVGLTLLAVVVAFVLLRGAPPFHDKLGWAAWAVPAGVTLIGLMRIAEGWNVRGKRYKRLAAGDMTMAGGNAGLRLVSGFLAGSSVVALLVSYFSALIAKTGLLARAFPFSAYDHKVASRADLRRLAGEYSDFPKYNATAEFARSVAQRLPVLLLGYLFTPAIVGFFAMGMRLVQTPLGLLVTSFRRVYLQRAAEMFNAGRDLRGPLLKATLYSLALAVGPFLVLWFFGQEILTLLLGERWSFAGRYAEILAPFLLMTWITTPSSATLIVTRRQKAWLWIQLSVAAAQLVAMLTANRIYGTPEATIGAHVMVGVVGNLCVIALTMATVPPPDGGADDDGDQRDA